MSIKKHATLNCNITPETATAFKQPKHTQIYRIRNMQPVCVPSTLQRQMVQRHPQQEKRETRGATRTPTREHQNGCRQTHGMVTTKLCPTTTAQRQAIPHRVCQPEHGQHRQHRHVHAQTTTPHIWCPNLTASGARCFPNPAPGCPRIRCPDLPGSGARLVPQPVPAISRNRCPSLPESGSRCFLNCHRGVPEIVCPS